jgi:hypothetical protein
LHYSATGAQNIILSITVSYKGPIRFNRARKQLTNRKKKYHHCFFPVACITHDPLAPTQPPAAGHLHARCCPSTREPPCPTSRRPRPSPQAASPSPAAGAATGFLRHAVPKRRWTRPQSRCRSRPQARCPPCSPSTNSIHRKVPLPRPGCAGGPLPACRRGRTTPQRCLEDTAPPRYLHLELWRPISPLELRVPTNMGGAA